MVRRCIAMAALRSDVALVSWPSDSEMTVLRVNKQCHSLRLPAGGAAAGPLGDGGCPSRGPGDNSPSLVNLAALEQTDCLEPLTSWEQASWVSALDLHGPGDAVCCPPRGSHPEGPDGAPGESSCQPRDEMGDCGPCDPHTTTTPARSEAEDDIKVSDDAISMSSTVLAVVDLEAQRTAPWTRPSRWQRFARGARELGRRVGWQLLSCLLCLPLYRRRCNRCDDCEDSSSMAAMEMQSCRHTTV